MRSAGAVRQKLKQVRFRHLKRRIEADLQQCPANCRHNLVVDVPPAPSVRMCTHGPANGDSGAMAPCDERWDQGARALSCPFFTLRLEKEQVKEAFKAEVMGMSLAQIAQDYPDMAALMWVLGDESDGIWEDIDEEDVFVPPPVLSSEPSTPPTPASAPSERTDSSDPPPPAPPLVVVEPSTWGDTFRRWFRGLLQFERLRLAGH